MTVLQLFTYICAALLLQLTMGIGAIVGRRRATVIQKPKIDGATIQTNSSGAWAGWRDFRVMRRTFEDIARSQCSFYLQPVDGVSLPSFKAGQYLTFSLQIGKDPDPVAGANRNIIRCYSLSDRPDSTNYRITIKRMPSPSDRPELPPGVCSSYFLDQIQEGAILKVKAPSGQFFIDADATVPAVLIAGGVGITPMISMLRWCAAEQPDRTVHLFYGVRSSVDQAFSQLLSELSASMQNFKLHVVHSCPGQDEVQGRDYHQIGHIDIELLRANLPTGRHRFYVCGPPPMMQSLVPALREWGVNEDDIRTEAFGPASARPDGPATNEPLDGATTSLEVRLNRSARTLVWDGQDANLLDFAERQGVAVEAGCRSGSCGTCETTLTSGTVQYVETPGYQIASGRCLLCIAKPQSALVLDI